jgi:hypothetical protein
VVSKESQWRRGSDVGRKFKEASSDHLPPNVTITRPDVNEGQVYLHVEVEVELSRMVKDENCREEGEADYYEAVIHFDLGECSVLSSC